MSDTHEPCPECGAEFWYTETSHQNYYGGDYFDQTREVWRCGREEGMNSNREMWEISCKKEARELEFFKQFVKTLITGVDEMEGISQEDLLKAKKLLGVNP